MEPYKRDLPEIVAEILIEQHAMREEMREMREDIGEMREDIGEMRGDINALRTEMREGIGGLREDARESAARMENLFSVMTNAILDAMNRQTDRQISTDSRVDNLQGRVEKLEDRAGDQAR